MEKNNNISGMINLARNMGGSIGIAGLETILARRTRFHQNVLSSHTSEFGAAFYEQKRGSHHAIADAGGLRRGDGGGTMAYAKSTDAASAGGLAGICGHDFRVRAGLFRGSPAGIFHGASEEGIS